MYLCADIALLPVYVPSLLSHCCAGLTCSLVLCCAQCGKGADSDVTQVPMCEYMPETTDSGREGYGLKFGFGIGGAYSWPL